MEMDVEVRLCGQNAINKGVLANVEVYLWNKDKTARVFRLGDLTIINGKNGKFIGSPRRKYTRSDGSDGFYSIIKVGPDEKFGDGSATPINDSWTTFVLDHYNAAVVANGGSPARAAPAQSLPAAPSQAPANPPAQPPAGAPPQPAW